MTSALSTDLYGITMATSYLRRRMRGPATFSLFVRQLPPQRGFLVAAGLASALEFLESFHFEPDEVADLAELLRLTPADRDRFQRLRFTGDVWAVPEGTVVPAGVPLLEVTAPVAEAQLVETTLVNLLSFATTAATKAARCRLAAPHAELVDFGMRRAQGLEAADVVARASAIAGFDATSNVLAARRYGLGVSGTMAHSFVEAFPAERDAFAAFAADFPDRVALLVDTYDTVEGVRTAASVIAGCGAPHAAIRLDSGDLAALSRQARAVLDAAGLFGVRIIASGSLDEYALDDLVRAGVPIDAYGVGTRVGVSADAPYLDSAYKLVDYGGRPMFKRSTGKATLPGRKQVFRAPGRDDLLGLRDEPAPPGSEPLLREVMRAGRRVHEEPLELLRGRCAGGLAGLREPHRRLAHPQPLPLHLTAALRDYARDAGAVVPEDAGPLTPAFT